MKLFNTLSGTLEPFSPDHDPVTMYVCGITPYAASHVGHAMSAVVFDVVRRYLEFKGYGVRHVQNFTDIDDKMIDAAARSGVSISDLAESNIRAFLEEMDALNVLRAHVYPRATGEIPRILEMIGGLVDDGYAYPADGDVYFRVRKDPDYGKLSHRTLDGMRAGARVEVNERKEDAMDFALWKGRKPGEPHWDSPWGSGRPGWHIECSAMSLAYLGETLDIHGGGQDLVFPHHENEVAQSESYTKKQPFARFWLHNGLLRLGDGKMSKSVGNIVSVREALERHSADALRLFFLSSHYRAPLSYTDDGVVAQERGAERLRVALETAGVDGDGEPLDPAPHRGRFLAAMDDDLNTPRAIAALFDLAHDINRCREQGRATSQGRETLRELVGVLGLTLKPPETGFAGAPFIDLLIETRKRLREAKQFDLADRIREELADLGIVLEDSAGGTTWKPKVS